MISKAKILFYGMFRRPKTSSTKEKKVNFLNKLLLLQVRRYKKYKDIPTTISVFDWQESKLRAWKHYKVVGYCLFMYIAMDIIWFFKYRRIMVAEKLYEERQKRNLPARPLYDVFGENPEYGDNTIDVLFEKTDSNRETKSFLDNLI